MPDSKRRRLGVALLFDPRLAAEIDGLRKALGDRQVGRIPPHLTLAPPVNVRGDRLRDALAVLRSAAAAVPGSMRLTLGPPGSFLPANPVLYLEVGGALPGLRAVRDAVFREPLARPRTWPWVPHVTLADEIEEQRITAALEVLDRYAAVADVDRVVLLEERPGRVWLPLADAVLGPPAVVGTGGLAVEISRSQLIDPEAGRLLPGAGGPPACGGGGPPACGGGGAATTPFAAAPIVLTARREGEVAGVAVAWLAADGGHAGVMVAPPLRLQGIGGHLLVHLEATARAEGWDYPSVRAHGPIGFFEARSGWFYVNSTAE